MVIFEQVTKSFGSTTAIKDVTFAIQPGEFVFMTGPSGSGKTTLARLLTAELKPTAGSIQINNQELSKLKSRQIPHYRQKLGVIFQDFKLIPYLTIFENIAVALQVKGVRSIDIPKQVHHVARLVGLETRLQVFPTQVAGGELQRACMARAIVGQPQLLLADEPTGNLDPATSWQIMQIFEKINRQGTTIIMATHNMDIVNSLKKRTLKLEHGQLIQDQPAE